MPERPGNNAMRIDCHNHGSFAVKRWPAAADMVKTMQRLGISQVCCSHPVTRKTAAPEEVEAANDDVLAAMNAFPNVILGQCYVNPGHARHAQDEITRCVVDGGMVGVKLYYQYRMDDPVQYPIIERCIDLGVHILMHAAHPTDPADIAMQPLAASAEQFIPVAKRYPEAMLICGHIGGGGDWEWQLKALRETPSVYLDTSGSVIDRGMIERCVRDVGVDRMLFGTDMNLTRGVGKLLDARLTERRRARIFGENFCSILAKRKC